MESINGLFSESSKWTMYCMVDKRVTMSQQCVHVAKGPGVPGVH